MSRPQLYLTAVLVTLIVLGLPSFILTQRFPASEADPERKPRAKESFPDTELLLEQTDRDEREAIRNRWKVELNTATLEELQSIPTIGPHRARSIVNYRRKDNRFHRVADLDAVKGFGERSVELVRDHVKIAEKYRRQTSSPRTSSRKVNLNSASAEQLQTLPGVGPVTARRIIAYRKENGAISSESELDEVSGIGPKTIESISSRVQGLSEPASPEDASDKINVNSADQAALKALTGIGPVTARRIIQYRGQHGHFSSVSELKNVDGIGDVTLNKIKNKIRLR